MPYSGYSLVVLEFIVGNLLCFHILAEKGSTYYVPQQLLWALVHATGVGSLSLAAVDILEGVHLREHGTLLGQLIDNIHGG